MDSSILCLKDQVAKILNFDVFLSLKIDLILANEARPDEMPHNVAFHLGLHYLPKYLLAGIQNEKGKV